MLVNLEKKRVNKELKKEIKFTAIQKTFMHFPWVNAILVNYLKV